MLERLLDHFGPGTHHDDQALGLGITDVFDQVVLASGEGSELVHLFLHNAWNRQIERVGRLASLEVDVGVLRGAADERVRGAERPLAVLQDQPLGYHGAQLGVFQHVAGVQLVAGAEAVEEVHERNAGVHGGGLGDQGVVVALLHRVGRQHRPTGLASGHHVLVVAENRQALRGQRPSRHVHDGAGQLTGDLVHVGDHQQQALGRGERRRQGTCLQRAVQRASRATLGLHLDDRRHLPEHVRLPLGSPLVGQLGHRRGRGDRVDRTQLVDTERDVGGSGVPVDDGAFARLGSGLVAVEVGHRVFGTQHVRVGCRNLRISSGSHHFSAIISMACTGHWS